MKSRDTYDWHDPLITWTTLGNLTIRKIFISTIARFMVSKAGTVLTYGKRFGTQTLKLSPTCFIILLVKPVLTFQYTTFINLSG